MSPKPTETVTPAGRGILLDEMLSPSIAEQLRGRGLDAIALTEVPGLSGVADDEVQSVGPGDETGHNAERSEGREPAGTAARAGTVQQDVRA